MLAHDLVTLAEAVPWFALGAVISIAWRTGTPRYARSRSRLCPQCRGRLSRWCRTCNGTGRVPDRRRT